MPNFSIAAVRRQPQEFCGVETENLVYSIGADGQVCYRFHVALDPRGPGPVAAKNHFVCVAGQFREKGHQFGRG